MIDVYTLDTHFFSARGSRLSVEGLLRPLLGEWGIPRSAKIIKNKYGKPYLRDYPEVHFNGSHSGRFLVCAFSKKSVGVDVQEIDRSKNTMAIAQRFMTAKEVGFLESLGAEEAVKAFYRLWAQKESYMKYTGLGFGIPLNSFEIKETNGGPHVWRGTAKVQDIFFNTAAIHKDYVLWVCGEDEEIRLVQRTPEIISTMTEKG